MKIKPILSIAVFAAAFIFSTFFAGLFVDKSAITLDSVVPPVVYEQPTSCFGHKRAAATAEKINSLLRQDDRNGDDRDQKVRAVSLDYTPPFSSDKSFSDYARFTSEYADKSGGLRDARNLPPEFQTAWQNHMKAWRDYADFLEAMKTDSVRDELGEEAFNDFEESYNIDINSTWYEVLRVASEYGASVEEF